MFRFSLATNDVQALTRTSKSVFLRTLGRSNSIYLGRSNSVYLYRCAKEGKFMLCVPKMQIALVPIKRKIKFNVVDTFIRVSVFFLFLFFVLAFFTIAIVKQLYYSCIRCYIPLHSVTSVQRSYFSGFRPTHSVYSTFSHLSTIPISDSILAKDITLDCSKAWICFAHWSRHVYFTSFSDNIGEFRCSMAEIGSHYDYVLTLSTILRGLNTGYLYHYRWSTRQTG